VIFHLSPLLVTRIVVEGVLLLELRVHSVPLPSSLLALRLQVGDVLQNVAIVVINNYVVYSRLGFVATLPSVGLFLV